MIIVCIPIDDRLRPRNPCLLNPFRNRDAERVTEQVLQELKNGNAAAILPYLSERTPDEQQHLLGRESEYRITGWRLAGAEREGLYLTLDYWVSRANYPVDEEEAKFGLVQTDYGWKVKWYSAIY